MKMMSDGHMLLKPRCYDYNCEIYVCNQVLINLIIVTDESPNE